MLRPEDACQERISWFSNWNPKVQKRVNFARSRQELSNEYLLAKFGVDAAENGRLKVYQKLAES